MTAQNPPTRLLRIDLSSEHITSERVPENWLRAYLGGKGLGARYLFSELEAGVDPLSAENVLLFMCGPLSGLLPGETRYAAITKSPLTGTFLDAYSGGQFAASLAGALGDHIGLLLEGEAAEPLEIIIENGAASLEASELWGSDTVETAAALEGDVACIGPAGEEQLAYATIAADAGEHHAGRGGGGAVLGQKQVKAVVARGSPPEGLEELREAAAANYREHAVGQWQQVSGTVESVDFAAAVGALATRGWQTDSTPVVDGLGIEAVRDRSHQREHTDPTDPGDFRVALEAGESVPRGATAMSLGSGLGITDFEAVAELGDRCNRLGVDLISAGSAIAWAIRASHAGIIDRSFEFGSPADASEVLTEIVGRETPLGDALADGVEAGTARYGGKSLIPTVKAMALPAYDPRGAPSMALAYATSDRGACHRRARPVEREVFDKPWSPERTASAVIAEQNRRSVLWSLISDDFIGDSLEALGSAWLEALGLEPAGELVTVGERVWTLTRLFNCREGFSRVDDRLPPSLAGGDTESVDRAQFEAALEQYYEQRGWDSWGYPTPPLLKHLDLEWTRSEVPALQ